MPAPKVDPALLEREYVTSTLSLRELARRHEISWSALATRARKKDAAGLTWTEKREAFQAAVGRKSFDKTADKLAREDVDIRSELINVNRATLAVYIQQLKDQKIAVKPSDAVAATSALLNLLGEPTNRTETKIVDGISSAGGGTDLERLRQLAEVARRRIDAGPVATGTGPDTPSPKPN